MSGQSVAVGLVGYGKIAKDQHVPSIAGDPRFHLAGVASPRSQAESAPTFPDLETLLRERPDVQAVAICTPPDVRHGIARQALEAGRHVLLEKPPAASLSEAEDLVASAEKNGVTLFAAWHSRFAAGVEPARAWLADRTVRQVRVDWKEDVDKWHPGQAWIWTPAGMGVFDPGVNALSIVTRILPEAVTLSGARLHLRRAEESAIAAELQMRTGSGASIMAEFDWRPRAQDEWSIRVETDRGALHLTDGAAQMSVDGTAVELPESREYPGVYARFAELIAAGRSEVDLRPLMLVADANLRGERTVL